MSVLITCWVSGVLNSPEERSLSISIEQKGSHRLDTHDITLNPLPTFLVVSPRTNFADKRQSLSQYSSLAD
jgi:hypothetical protein